MGTPDDSVWGDVSTLPDFKASFPKWRARSVGVATPTLCAAGIDLLEKMLAYEPYKRITPRQALAHPYFVRFRAAPQQEAEHLPAQNPHPSPTLRTPPHPTPPPLSFSPGRHGPLDAARGNHLSRRESCAWRAAV